MGAFGGMVLTNKGIALQAKTQAGAQLQFTRFGVGDGSLGSNNIAELNTLINQVKSINISKLKSLSAGKAVVGFTLSNQDVVTGFYFREIGVFAQDPDLGEILYCYANCGVTAEYIPAGGGPDIIEKSIDVITVVGTSANITAVIDETLIFVTGQELLDHTNDAAAHGATSEAAASKIIVRDASGRAKVAAPSASDDIAIKSTVDAVQTNLNNHANASDPHSQYATDTDLSNHANLTNTAHGATSAATANKLIARDASGRAKVAAPLASDDIAIKSTVDAVQTNLNNHANASDPHSQYATDADLSNHVGAGGSSHASATTTAAGFMSSADKSKLNGIATGAEVNQNAFSTVKVGGTNISADNKTDLLELVAGNGIVLTPDDTNDKIIIADTLIRVGCHAYASTGQLFTADVDTKVIYDTVVENVGNCYNPANSEFTAPKEGWYLVESMVTNGQVASANANHYLTVRKYNSSTGLYDLLERLDFFVHPTIYGSSSAGSALVYLLQNDKIRIYHSSSQGHTTMATMASQNWLRIKSID